jgi:dTDP-4-amino-4,6-dideoxygalactose transaminase
MDCNIPFNRPCFQGKELAYIAKAIESGQISGDGAFTKKCSRFLEEELGVKRALLTPSCTAALEMAAILLDIQPDDEVIVPSYTFVSTVNAFVLRGARPVFIDIRPDTLNMDERLLEGLITERTKAIIPVHYAGVGCEMDTILEIADRHGIAVVEDNAHGLFGKYKGRYLGTFGKMSTLSFHETKNFTCGEGGALLLNDKSLIQRAEIIREKGTDRSRFFRGEVDKYTWVDIGSSYLPSDVTAAFLYAQLEAKERVLKSREAIWNRYYEGLKDWAEANSVGLPYVPEHCEQAWHMFYLLMPDGESRDKFIAYLKSKKIMSVFHYVPLHESKMGQKFSADRDVCSVTDNVSKRLVRLPFFNDIISEIQSRVIHTTKEGL